MRPRLAGSTVPTIGPPPGPRRIEISPCTSSRRSPSRSDSRLTLYCSSIAASAGRPSPGCRPAATMSWTTSRATASDVFSGRVIDPPERMAIDCRRAPRRRAPSGAVADLSRRCARSRWPPGQSRRLPHDELGSAPDSILAVIRGLRAAEIRPDRSMTPSPPSAGSVVASPGRGCGGRRRAVIGGAGGAPLRDHDRSSVDVAELVEPHLQRHPGGEVGIAREVADEAGAG